MIREYALPQRFTLRELPNPSRFSFERERSIHKEPQAPEVKIYNPSNPEDIDALNLSLRQVLYPNKRLRRTFSRFETVIKKAIESQVLIDTYPEFLKDRAYRTKGKDYYRRNPKELEDYVNENNKWENTRIVEFMRERGEGRFIRVPVQEDLEEVVHSGNGEIIPKEIRELIGNKRVAFAGAGVGSSLLEGAIRAGVRKATIADGGKILYHDQGRLQSPDLTDTLEYHAVDAARKALKFNPYLDIRCFPKNIGLEDTDTTVSIDTFLKDVDIVFEEIDNLQMKILIRERARELGIPVVMITDVGMGTMVDYQPGDYKGNIFPGLSRRLYNRAKSGKVKSLKEATKIAIQMVGPEVNYWREDVKRHPFWSQTAAAADASKSKAADVLVRWVKGDRIPYRKSFGVDKPTIPSKVWETVTTSWGRRNTYEEAA